MRDFLIRSILGIGLLLVVGVSGLVAEVPNSRRPANEADLRFWLENMVWHHRFSDAEIRLATGMSLDEIQNSKQNLNIHHDNSPSNTTEQVKVLPFPGGPHPRIGFLEGAIEPQRETKVSVFTPWQSNDGQRADFVVVDVPEAIWSNLGLTYLAHTHIDTIWTKQDVELEKLEWDRRKNGVYFLKRILPNGISFSTTVIPKQDHVAMQMTLTNGTQQRLSDLRVQNCVMLKFAEGFQQQTNENKVNQSPFAAAHDVTGKRWVITGWTPTHRAWANADCPCLHSDPIFPECGPGETVNVSGFLAFYEGEDIKQEFQRIRERGWLMPISTEE